ncbi:deoxynucleoside kinase [Flavobacteriaceae bacterium]|nr:deoxynucleoside kinase [Flavobacteriaceae bacterium]
MASEYKLPLLQEAFAKNPYLEKFYADPKTYGLAVEQFFLLDRIKQGQEFWKKNKGKAVSDYTIQKSLIFARQNLNDTNFKAYKTRFEEAYPSQKLPDLMVYLYTDMNTLQAQIKKRGRSFEQGIKKEYLEQIELGYQKLIAKDLPYSVVSINTKGLDFESNRDHYQSLLRLIYRVSF